MKTDSEASISQREVLGVSATASGPISAEATTQIQADQTGQVSGRHMSNRHLGVGYEGVYLNRLAFPLGGIGAGMICLEGTGAVSHFSLRNKPDVFNEPLSFAAIAFPGRQLARVLEGQVPGWKLFGSRGAATGALGSSFGLPRFRSAKCKVRFPFATVVLDDDQLPLQVELTGWSPFTPGDADSSSLPVAALEYRFTNPGTEAIEAVFSYNSKNVMALKNETSVVRPTPGGFIFRGSGEADHPWEEGFFSAAVNESDVKVNHAWFRGNWFDPLTMTWNDISNGACVERPPVTDGPPTLGASLFVPFRLAPGASRTIAVRLCWYAGKTDLWHGTDPYVPGAAKPERLSGPTYIPWYATRFTTIDGITAEWCRRYDELRQRSLRFADCFYDTTMPPEVVEAVSANLAILKSPTILRQADGRIWAWEGCRDDRGCGPGSCTHVWNYAQAIAHLFPALERGLRETEFGDSQDESGHQMFRSSLPIRPLAHDYYAAADGQLGGIMKMHRDWRISGDTEWLRRWWPRVRQSLDYCIETWDPGHKGWIEEPHHNTYDVEFWGPDGMCTSIYLGALLATVRMGRALEEDVTAYEALQALGLKRAESELFDGEYFHQKVEWKNLRATDPTSPQYTAGDFSTTYSPEARTLFLQEGPKYQYGIGCLADGVLGSWFALVCGVGQVLDPKKVSSHLEAVYRYNLKKDLLGHVNPQRSSYAAGEEGGLLLCTWPKGGTRSLPLVYANEIWTGIEYQVASHLLLMGQVKEGLEIVRTCRARYDGRVRNPFDEYEYGHWYGRALSSYTLLQGWSGARYDAVDKVLHLQPPHTGDYHCFLATATGYGIVGVRAGLPFLEVRDGDIEVGQINYSPCT